VFYDSNVFRLGGTGFRDKEAKRVRERAECLRCSFTDAVMDFVLTAMVISCVDVTRFLGHVTSRCLLDIYCLFSEINLVLDLVEQLVVGHLYFMPY
jgi:hypothetical protein